MGPERGGPGIWMAVFSNICIPVLGNYVADAVVGAFGIHIFYPKLCIRTRKEVRQPYGGTCTYSPVGYLHPR